MWQALLEFMTKAGSPYLQEADSALGEMDYKHFKQINIKLDNAKCYEENQSRVRDWRVVEVGWHLPQIGWSEEAAGDDSFIRGRNDTRAM